jgi:hypothetical protein
MVVTTFAELYLIHKSKTNQTTLGNQTMKSHEIAAYNTTLAELAKLAADMNCPKALAAIARLQVNVGRNWSSSGFEG